MLDVEAFCNWCIGMSLHKNRVGSTVTLCGLSECGMTTRLKQVPM